MSKLRNEGLGWLCLGVFRLGRGLVWRKWFIYSKYSIFIVDMNLGGRGMEDYELLLNGITFVRLVCFIVF